MASEDSGEIVAGTAQGAAAGGQVGGVYGAIIGGVIGLGAGLWSSKKRKQARRMAAGAAALRQDAVILRQFAEQRTLIRQGQVAAAGFAGNQVNSGADISSSQYQGVRSSVYTQLMDNFLLGEKALQDQIVANKLDKDSAKKQAEANSIMAVLNVGSSASSSFGSNS